jgi:hypothetical protein
MDLGYPPLVNDTTAGAQARYHELLKARTPAAKLAIAMSLTRSVRELAMAGIRAQFPHASDRELTARLAERMYGVAVARRLFDRI